jgi:hypothetical protein
MAKLCQSGDLPRKTQIAPLHSRMAGLQTTAAFLQCGFKLDREFGSPFYSAQYFLRSYSTRAVSVKP